MSRGPHSARDHFSRTATNQCNFAPSAISTSLRLAELHSPLPCDLYIWADRGYTGQPVVEIHTIGSPPLLQMVLRGVCAAGARPAERGEFTLRAFLAGRIDLTQAEAVLGVIDAADSHELDVALGQLAGGLARPLRRLRDALLDLLAHLEAGFDFADEDLDRIGRQELSQRLITAESDIAAISSQIAARTETADVVRVVLVGRPNTGKSSLFNALAGNRSALVSEHAGTTRDYLAAALDLDGVVCQLIDTAGTGDTDRPSGGDTDDCDETPHKSVDYAAQTVAAQQRQVAQVRILCIDSTRQTDAWERGELARSDDEQRIVALTKCDAPRQTDATSAAVETSSISGHGIAPLRTVLRQRALAVGGRCGSVVASTAVRCADSLRLAGDCLRRAGEVAATGQEELVAAELRAALEELGKVIGAVYSDDVLARIFSRFCIGK